MTQAIAQPEVLTLKETAEFLRIPEDAVERLVIQQGLPARRIGSEWRFLKAAIADWLRERSGKAILLSQAGVLADDESLPELRAAIYSERGRPEAEDD